MQLIINNFKLNIQFGNEGRYDGVNCSTIDTGTGTGDIWSNHTNGMNNKNVRDSKNVYVRNNSYHNISLIKKRISLCWKILYNGNKLYKNRGFQAINNLPAK